MDIDKDQLRKEFAHDWEVHYKINALIERGFKRQKCKSCSKAFWAKEQRDQCGDAACIGYQFIGSTPVKKKLDYIQTWKTIEKYFTGNGHGYVKPYPSVARWRDDLYFTIASINDFQPYVVNGEMEAPSNPLIVPQPCIRFPDISNVGVSGRHYTNFVMVGQHAFNTKKTGLFYWKEEAMTHDLNYLKALGIPEDEIIFTEDVWAGGGNYGPCIEYFVRGLELGNCVFMQYETTPKGSRELPTKVIDMGAGLARLAWITSGEPTSYEVVFGPVIRNMKKQAGISVDRDLFLKFAKISGSLNEDEVKDLEKEKERVAAMLGISKKELFETLEPLQALYASADHLKTLLFTSTDGLLPSNSGGGYNLRLLLRRVFGFQERYGYDLDYAKIVEDHADYVNYIFPHLKEGVKTTADVIAEEEKRYRATKEKARNVIINIIKKAKSPKEGISNKERAGAGKITKEDLVTLYKSDGIPPESILEIANENGVSVEMPGNFYNLVREGEGKEFSEGNEPSVKILFTDVASLPKTKILYYTEKSRFKATVLATIKDKYVVLDHSAFYPEGGGQVSDTGTMGGKPVVYVTKQAGVILHETKGKFKEGEIVDCFVDLERRKTIARHHTGAHILNAAARAVLGSHVWQGGSNKDENKAHLDITHYSKITTDQLQQIELKANEYIIQNLPITVEVLPRNVAEEKYGFTLYQGGAVPGKELRVVSIGNIDSEACGGTHHMLKSTGEIGCFKIIKREGVHDGIERIVFKCGIPALKYIHEKENLLREASAALSVPEYDLVKTSRRFFDEWKSQKKKIESLNEMLIIEEANQIEKSATPVFRIVDLEPESLKKLAVKISSMENAAACFVNKHGNIVCACGKASKYSAKSLLEKVLSKLGGSGGGRDNVAQGKVNRIELVDLE
ncbi:alanine--tRNA ligase [Candidatus Micrarchaeota archaeon]|nr:alanine--tRNA ligase [Candidatus Micrarchaeota archaeon]